ncbi:CRISPR-associated protein Cas7/Cst2/DevR, subtype I-B/TNEAP [Xylanibacter oryzae]|uniref:CRISPR-associated protein Cas7/Cst2/DevR, subtype I-B/TNEAP n=1 Tax=Xylanibacter oryzae TaxID=185293 RepID=UPI0004B51B7C|nr:CRISPR-associated protein Cas7/Cst2/DevR, subtype I-B/TNEAP [Xylanibacter oryzae]
MNPYIYLRELRNVEHTVFCVQDRQKSYRDFQFNRLMAYSSGQQVKRSIIQAMADILNVRMAPITFNWQISGNSPAKQGQPFHPCNPTYIDQLIGGYMKAENDALTIKRRSPLSISAMRPLHPLLGGLEREPEAANFDRKGFPSTYNSKDEVAGVNNIRVYRVDDKKQIELTDKELNDWLKQKERELPPHYYNPNSQYRASGLYVYDVAIDLRTLFCVSTNQIEPEVSKVMLENLKERGWIETENVFGKCLLLPKEERDKVIPALADSLINWRITSNQARTFSLMETLAVAISDNANTIAATIRAKLIDDGEKPKAKPIVEKIDGADLYITLPCANYIVTESENANALAEAKQDLIDRMNAFDFQNQK